MVASVPIDTLADIVACETCVSVSAIKGTGKKPRIRTARCWAMWLAWKSGYTSREIAAELGAVHGGDAEHTLSLIDMVSRTRGDTPMARLLLRQAARAVRP